MWNDNHYGKLSQNCTIRGPACPPKIRNVQASCMVDSKVHFHFLLMPNYHNSGLFWKPILYQKEVYCTLLHLQIPSPPTLVPPSMRHIAAVFSIWACCWDGTKATMSPTACAKFPIIISMMRMMHCKNGSNNSRVARFVQLKV